MKGPLLHLVTVALALVSFTACTEYYDWDAIPNSQVVQIPQKGGTYNYSDFETWWVEDTRFEPGETHKCYRYRLQIGDKTTKKRHDNTMVIEFEVPANHTGEVRDVKLQISKAKKFHDTKLDSTGKCWWTNLSESQWEDWETVWRGVQAA